MIIGFAGFHFFKQFSGISKTGSHSDLHVHARHIVSSFFNTFGSADIDKIKIRELLTGQCFYCGTEGRFHNATGCSKDNRRAGRFSQRIVKIFIRQLIKADTEPFNHTGQFSGRHGVIHIRYAGCALVRTADLEFLCCTWHDADTDDLLRINTHLFRIIGF